MTPGDVAIEAEDLQIGWESLLLNPRVKLSSRFGSRSAIRRAVIVGVIQRQERGVRLAAAGALSPVMGEHSFLQCPRLAPSPISPVFKASLASPTFFDGSPAVAALIRSRAFSLATRTAKAVRFGSRKCAPALCAFGLSSAPNDIRIAVSPPSGVMHRAPTTGEMRIRAIGDGANLSHFRSHPILADARQEIKSWAA